MRGGRNKQDIDDFINDELGAIGEPKTTVSGSKPAIKPTGGATSKPAFALASKKPAGALGSKPSFAIKKKTQAVDDLIESELGNIDKTPVKRPAREADEDPLTQSYQPDAMSTPLTQKKEIKKGPAVFMKPNLPTKKKF